MTVRNWMSCSVIVGDVEAACRAMVPGLRRPAVATLVLASTVVLASLMALMTFGCRRRDEAADGADDPGPPQLR